ncbi:hypothetical protein ACWA2C_16005 [Priestia megaterium]
MAKLWNQMIKNFTLKNAPSDGGTSTGGVGALNRDPKAIQVKRVGYQYVDGGGGRDSFEGPQADFALIDTAIQRDSYIMQTMMKYSELVFKSGWYFAGKNDQSLLYLKLRLEMMAVATGVPTEELFQGIADDIVRYGNCFIAKARAKNGVGLPPGLAAVPILPAKDPIAGYFRLPPNTITISRDINGTILKYRQEVDGADKPTDFNPEDIIHISVNRPVGRPFGLPWIAPVLEDVRLLRKVEENAALLLYRHIFPLLSYTVGIDKPGYEASDDELAELQSVIENMPTDGAIVLPERHKIEAVKMSTIDGKPYLEYFEQRVFTGLGMSSVDMGRGDTANRNTADAMGGIKADRVKGWQKALQVQIDKYIVDEILIEGGFDPLVNLEFDVNFIFEEIEQERKIAKENHTLLKWNSNVASFEEVRHELGYDPTVDESRLQFAMIGMAVAEHGAQLATSQDSESTAKETDNKNAPENQNGKKSAPKKATESLTESVFERVMSEGRNALQESLLESYRLLESDTLGVVEAHIKKQTFPIKEPKEWLASLHFSKDKMLRTIQHSTQSAIAEGIAQARTDTGRTDHPDVSRMKAVRVVKDYASESLDNIEKVLKSTLSERLKSSKNKEEAILAVKGIFGSTNHRLTFMSKTLLAKSYNFGYALSLMKYGEEHARSVYEGSCLTCQEKAKELISLQQYSSLDEIAIFYRIPSWHPNCDCPLEYVEGGEK